MENLVIFISACLVFCMVPGPDMAFLLSTSVARGKKAGMSAALGMNAGAYVHLLAATLGLSAILLSSATAFTVVKWLGAAYMLYLGLKVLFSTQPMLSAPEYSAKPRKSGNFFWMGFLTDVLNPKVAIFFLSFIPQFVSPDSSNPARDMMLLGVILNVIAIVFNLFMVQFAGLVSKKLRSNEGLSKWLNRLLGITFIGIAVKLATEKQ